MGKKVDTIKGEQELVENEAKPLLPPEFIDLNDEELLYWETIVRARAKDTWNAHDLVQAANLARCDCDIDRLQHEIKAEGDVLLNAKGTQIVNPKHSLLETLSRRSVALTRLLHIHPEATVTAKDMAKKNTASREAQKKTERVSKLELLAKPGE